MIKIAFISTMYGETWGGSEHLWGQTAHALLKEGHRVAAGVNHWPGPSGEWDSLEAAGCELHVRQFIPRLHARVINRLLPTSKHLPPPNSKHDWLVEFRPDLVVVSQAFVDDGLEVLEMCRHNSWKYASIVHTATESHWPGDGTYLRLRDAYHAAVAAFFVSEHNLRLTERQIAARIPLAEIVRNPFGVDHRHPLPWPEDGEEYKLACVGRLQPNAKGHDILLEVLSREEWRKRPVSVTFFGKGTNRNHIEELAALLDVRNIRFGGFVSGVSEIWKDHHAVVMPSRMEGLPVVLVEASLAGRLSICTRTAGIPEVVDDGVTGFLCMAPEANLFAEAMERAWENRERWAEMGMQAADKVRALVPEHPAETFAARLIQLVSEK
jgi:glycosyltransferase involved in cell wall biosynthesis